MQQVAYNKKSICSRCGKSMTKQCKILGDKAYSIHSELHYREDTQTYIEVAYSLAEALKSEGYDLEIMEVLRDLDPEAYERRVIKGKSPDAP